MSATGLAVGAPTDAALVAGVRAGEDAAFEELYRRYRPRVNAFVRRYVRDDGRAEDVTQDAFLSALRRMRVTDGEIAFKPWIYEIARNAAIDLHRRSRRAEEVSMEAVDLLPPSDRLRLLGTALPESTLATRERLQYLRGAFEDLSETHHRVLVLRELEGRSYREIAEHMDLTRPAVESALFRARRRLEQMYSELETGRRCEAVRAAIGRLAEGIEASDDSRRVARHVRRCRGCRRTARELGVEPVGRLESLRTKAAALLPLPLLLRPSQSDGTTAQGPIAALEAPSQTVTQLAERAVALLTAAAIASAGSALLENHLGRPAEPALPASQPAVGQGFGIPRLVLRAPAEPRARAPRRPAPSDRPAPATSEASKTSPAQAPGKASVPPVQGRAPRIVLPSTPPANGPASLRKKAHALTQSVPVVDQTVSTAQTVVGDVEQTSGKLRTALTRHLRRGGAERRRGTRRSG